MICDIGQKKVSKQANIMSHRDRDNFRDESDKSNK